MGGLFIAVVVAFPRGLAGVVTDQIIPQAARLGFWKRCPTGGGPAPIAERRRRLNRRAERRWPPTPISCSRSKRSRVSFDGFKAVNDLNLYIDEGELRVIIGPNGAGKTTVLDLICGRTKVSAGSIKFKDQEITELQGARDRPPRHRPQVPDPVHLRGPHRLRESRNLVSARPRRRRRAVLEAHRRGASSASREIAAMIFLEDQLDRPAETAQPRPEAMAGDRHAADPGPRAADARRAGRRHERRPSASKTAELLNAIIKNRSVIVIEHDMKFVESIAHRVTVLHQGKILAEGDMAARSRTTRRSWKSISAIEGRVAACLNVHDLSASPTGRARCCMALNMSASAERDRRAHGPQRHGQDPR